MSSASASHEYQPYGLPMGTVRGFLSVLICLFFWIVLLYPGDPRPAPLGHFFLLALVFMAFASHPLHEARTTAFLPWLMRFIFVGGSVVVVLIVLFKDSSRLSERMTPEPDQMAQWTVLLGCLAGGFASALIARTILGRNNELFQSLRAWVGVLAMLLLLFETLLQFVIIPNMSDKPSAEAMKIWEGILVAIVAAYFGSRA